MTVERGNIVVDNHCRPLLVWSITFGIAHAIPIVQSGRRTKNALTLVPAEMDDEGHDIVSLDVASRRHLNVDGVSRIGVVHAKHFHIIHKMMELHDEAERERDITRRINTGNRVRKFRALARITN